MKMNVKNGLAGWIKAGLLLLAVGMMAGCVGYVDDGYRGGVVVGTGYYYGPDYYYGRSAYGYSQRGYYSRHGGYGGGYHGGYRGRR
jgi:hypothetical protein